jgi:Na+/phosphate symporter
MKKSNLIVSIIGISIQCFGIGFMLYGVNNNIKFTWIGFGILGFGLIIIAIGLIKHFSEKQKKGKYL